MEQQFLKVNSSFNILVLFLEMVDLLKKLDNYYSIGDSKEQPQIYFKDLNY